MNLLWILIIVLVVVSLTGVPSFGLWNHGYGCGPSGIGAVIVIILLVLLLSGRL